MRFRPSAFPLTVLYATFIEFQKIVCKFFACHSFHSFSLCTLLCSAFPLSSLDSFSGSKLMPEADVSAAIFLLFFSTFTRHWLRKQNNSSRPRSFSLPSPHSTATAALGGPRIMAALVGHLLCAQRRGVWARRAGYNLSTL